MHAPRAWPGLALLALATWAGCACETSGPRDMGPRPDADRRADAAELTEDAAGEGMDAWLDPTLDADLDAPIDPRRIDADLDADQDVGPIAPPRDTGLDPSTDASARDSGARDGATDARPPTGACGILWARGDPLPESCLPRCARDTGDLFVACAGEPVCEAFVMVADTSRTGLLYIWEDESITEVDCEACVGTQRYSCWQERCADAANAWVDCVAVRMAEACMRQREILDRCLTPYRSEIRACENDRVPMCFPD